MKPQPVECEEKPDGKKVYRYPPFEPDAGEPVYTRWPYGATRLDLNHG